MPLRRSHTKSHHGCAVCKKRRIKCDESRPICGSCRKKGLPCTFDNSEPGPPCPASFGENDQRQRDESTIVLPLVELELLHHWHTATAVSLTKNEALSGLLQIQVPKEGLHYPFVMHGILALSALHLSQRCSGPRRQIYTDIAMHHHSQALSLFVPLLSDVTPQNCHSLFACSFLISCFSFASQGLKTTPSSTHMSEVIEVFKLVRGTASIVEKARPWIEKGDMRPLLKFATCTQQTPQSRHVHEVHSRLEALINQRECGHQSSHPPSSLRAILVRSNQHLLDLCDSSIASNNQVTVLAWPAIIDPEYLDHMQQLEPWCLITLAHYGAALHILTSAWWMEGWGKFLVNVAAVHLDDSARSAIAWPLVVVNEKADE